MHLEIDDMELLEELRQKLNLIEAYWWFVNNSTDGYCCDNSVNAKRTFERKHAAEAFDLMAILLERRDRNG